MSGSVDAIEPNKRLDNEAYHTMELVIAEGTASANHKPSPRKNPGPLALTYVRNKSEYI